MNTQKMTTLCCQRVCGVWLQAKVVAERLLTLLLRPSWLDYSKLSDFGKSLFQPENKILKKGFQEQLPKETILHLFEMKDEIQGFLQTFWQKKLEIDREKQTTDWVQFLWISRWCSRPKRNLPRAYQSHDIWRPFVFKNKANVEHTMFEVVTQIVALEPHCL